LEIEYLQYFGACSALSGFRMNEKEKKQQNIRIKKLHQEETAGRIAEHVK
jgi:hypothetical protein